MKRNKNSTVVLVAKAMGGLVFLAVFMINIVMFVQKDVDTGGLAFASLNAVAQDGESGGGEGTTTEGNKQLYGEKCFEIIDGKIVITKVGNTCIAGGQACESNPVGDCGV